MKNGKNNIYKTMKKKKNERIALLQLNPLNIKEANTIPTQYTRKEN